jgi:hypothetical protein
MEVGFIGSAIWASVRAKSPLLLATVVAYNHAPKFEALVAGALGVSSSISRSRRRGIVHHDG